MQTKLEWHKLSLDSIAALIKGDGVILCLDNDSSISLRVNPEELAEYHEEDGTIDEYTVKAIGEAIIDLAVQELN